MDARLAARSVGRGRSTESPPLPDVSDMTRRYVIQGNIREPFNGSSLRFAIGSVKCSS